MAGPTLEPTQSLDPRRPRLPEERNHFQRHHADAAIPGTLFKKRAGTPRRPVPRQRHITHVASVRSRASFIFRAPVAYQLGAGYVPIRKKGKLPHKTLSHTYDLEYGTDTLEMHEDALTPESRVLIIDDVLATGGTASATCKLIKSLKANVVGLAFVIELEFLHGREKLRGFDVLSLIRFSKSFLSKHLRSILDHFTSHKMWEILNE